MTLMINGEAIAADIRVPTMNMEMMTLEDYIVKGASQIGTLPTPLTELMKMVGIMIVYAATNIMGKINTISRMRRKLSVSQPVSTSPA